MEDSNNISKLKKIELSCINHIQKFLNPNSTQPKTNYVIQIIIHLDNSQKREWVIEKTYEEIEGLYIDMKKRYSNISNQIPKFPSKGIFSTKTNDELNKRRDQISYWFKECLIREFIYQDKSFLSFIKIDHSNYLLNIPDNTDNTDKKDINIDKKDNKDINIDNYIGSIDEKAIPSSEIIENNKNEIINSEVNVNKVDNNIPILSHSDVFQLSNSQIEDLFILKSNIFYVIVNNRSIPIKNTEELDKKNMETSGKIIALGCKEKGKFIEYNSLNLCFNNYLSYVYLNENYLFIGSENGKVYYLDLKLDSKNIYNNENLMNFSNIKVFKTSKIYSIGACEDSIYFCSKTKFKIISLITKVDVYEKKFGFNIKSALYLHKKIAFILVDENGILYYYCVKTNTLIFKSKISFSKNSNIIGFYYNQDNEKIYVLTKDLSLFIIDILDNDKSIDLKISNSIKLDSIDKNDKKANIKPTTFVVYLEKNLIYVGFKSGQVYGFGLLDGKVKYTTKISTKDVKKVLIINNYLLVTSIDGVIISIDIETENTYKESNIIQTDDNIFGLGTLLLTNKNEEKLNKTQKNSFKLEDLFENLEK